MATTPMQPGDAGAMDPEDQADGGADEGQEQDSDDSGYVIMIHVDADGKLTVGCETDADEAQEDQSGAPDDDSSEMQPAKDIKEALTMALQLYKQDGKADAVASHAQQIQSQGFSSGYDED